MIKQTLQKRVENAAENRRTGNFCAIFHVS